MFFSSYDQGKSFGLWYHREKISFFFQVFSLDYGSGKNFRASDYCIGKKKLIFLHGLRFRCNNKIKNNFRFNNRTYFFWAFSFLSFRLKIKKGWSKLKVVA